MIKRFIEGLIERLRVWLEDEELSRLWDDAYESGEPHFDIFTARSREIAKRRYERTL